MEELITPIEVLAEAFGRLPGVGKKTAVKYALSFIEMNDDKANAFIDAVSGVRSKVFRCKRCFNYSEDELCSICRSDKRDPSVICVVEDVRSLMAFERARSYSGVYHIIGGVISPMRGVTPDKLRIAELLERVSNGDVHEVILAMDATLEGETTAMYIAGLLNKLENIRVTRLAYGIPAGGDLEYADEITLTRAIQGRSEIK